MFKVFTVVFSVFNISPLDWFRTHIKLPLVKCIYDTVELYKQRTRKGVNNVKDILFRGSVVAFITSLLVWLSVFMYVAFYFAYVPTKYHERPVYLQFESCGNNKGVCSFPSAYVLLTKRQQLLMFGQPYKIQLDLEMPESPSNKDLGMFMVCADFRGKNGRLITHSCRSAMMHYRSSLIQLLYTIVYSPFYIFGSSEEKQQVTIELFSEFHETESEPVTDVYIEIQSQFIELYSAKFSIRAEFSGIRYVMFNWPVFSATIGITTNLFFIAILCVASWYQLINSEEYVTYKLLQARSIESPSTSSRDADDSSSIEDSSAFEDINGKEELRKRTPEKSMSEHVETLSP